MAYNDRMETAPAASARPGRRGPLVTAGVVLGLGLMGFLDGILFHQVLQWHHMLSTVDDPAIANDMALNTFWDGLFHMATYALTVAGLFLLWRAWRRPDVPRSGHTLVGALLVGAGAFNLVEGLVNHHLLGIHRVHPGAAAPLVWDLAYLALGLLLAAAGWMVLRGAAAAGDARARAGHGRAAR